MVNDDDLIRRGDALSACRYDDAHDCRDAIAALPAVTVRVPADVRDYAIDVAEAYDTMMEVERNPAGAWQTIQALAGHLAALEPQPVPDAAATDPKVKALVEAAWQMLIEYDDVDLDHAEPPSMTAAVTELRAALAALREGGEG